MKSKVIVFFIGTVAEYIKLFPVIEEVKKSNVNYKIIASGQNEIINTDIAKATDLKIDLQLSYEKDIVKNVFGLFSWFFKHLISAKKTIENSFDDVDFGNSIMVVHGDTLSTVLGAYTAKRLGMRVAHVEAGLRSHKLLVPFPEEIDRRLVSRISSYNFCQGEEARSNLKGCKGEIIITKYNTIIDSAEYAKRYRASSLNALGLNCPYCIFVIHRQENLLQTSLVKKIVSKAIEVSKTKKVVFVLHKITENTLIKLDLLETINSEDNIVTVNRMEYFDFINLLNGSDFVITDGGSNQEELYYFGKPTLILRKATERKEGLNENAILYNGDVNAIDSFVEDYECYNRNSIIAEISPSKLIAENLIRNI